MSTAVREMFSQIADRYDLANDILSCGIHRRWREQALSWSGFSGSMRILDICTGTGDVARALARRIDRSGTVVGIDFVGGMLHHAKRKVRRSGPPTVHFVQADAMQLPFENASFDGATIAFGIRNVDDPVACLCEIRRILKPQGRVLVLEFGKPQSMFFAPLYGIYSRHVMPRIGGAVTGNRAAYEYLPETARRFPDGSQFLQLLRDAGFSCVALRPFLSGLAYAYQATNTTVGVSVLPREERVG